MVYSFFIGAFFGVPFGCYLRERGFHRRMQDAYRVMSPGEKAPQMDGFRSTAKEFYEDLSRGKK